MKRRDVTIRLDRLSEQDEIDWDVQEISPVERLRLVFRLSEMHWGEAARGPLRRDVVRMIRRGRPQ